MKLKTFASGAPLPASEVNEFLVPDVPDDALAMYEEVEVPLRSGYTGIAWVRRSGMVYCFHASIQGAFTAGVTIPIADIPARFRPDSVLPLPSMFSSGDYNWGNITPAGTVSVRKTNTDTRGLYVMATWIGPLA